MKKIQLFDLTVAGLVKRFYLMMAVVIISGVFGQFIVAAVLGYAVAISFILGISFHSDVPKAMIKEEGRPVPLERNIERAAA